MVSASEKTEPQDNNLRLAELKFRAQFRKDKEAESELKKGLIEKNVLNFWRKAVEDLVSSKDGQIM